MRFGFFLHGKVMGFSVKGLSPRRLCDNGLGRGCRQKQEISCHHDQMGSVPGKLSAGTAVKGITVHTENTTYDEENDMRIIGQNFSHGLHFTL